MFFVGFLFSCSEEGMDDKGLGSLEGTVVDAATSEPLENVRITTSPASTTVFTDEEGKFFIEQITAGDYSVQASLEGYQTVFKPANVIRNVLSNVFFEMGKSITYNFPPSAPKLISPEQNSHIDSTSVQFVWTAEDPEGDRLIYKIELRNDKNSNVEIFEEIRDTFYTHSPLLLGAKYFWQVSASDGINEPVQSEVGTFTVTNSPVGNRYLFVRNIGGNNVIMSANDEGEEHQLTTENRNSFKPVRNVAADRIAYLQSTGAQVDIFTMKRDGTDHFKVTSNIRPNGFDLNEISIDWPRNSDYIYFANMDKLYRVRSSGQGLELLYQTSDGSLISEMAVSERRDIIVLKTNNLDGYDVEIYTINFAGDRLHTILSNVTGAANSVSLSEQSLKIIYTYDISGSTSWDYRRWDSRIYMYDVSTGNTIDLSPNKDVGTNDLEVRFSPNEAAVIFTNTSNDGISERFVYSLNIQDMKRKLLFSDAFMPDWR